MRTLLIENLVDFSELCSFAEAEGIACYNAAHDILARDAYPGPESNQRDVYLSELQEYSHMFDSPTAVEILTKYLEKHNVTMITVNAG